MKTIPKVAGVMAAVLLAPGLCVAQSATVRELKPAHENMHLKLNPSAARMLVSTVSGKIKLAKSSNGRPAGWINPIVLTNAKKSRAGADLELFAIPLR